MTFKWQKQIQIPLSANDHSSRNKSPSQDRLLLIRLIFCKAYWATPFKRHFDFRPLLRRTFTELSRNYPYPQSLAISRRRIRGKANTRGLSVWLLQDLTFGSLAAAFGACFLRLQKATLGSTSGRCKDVLQDHGIWRWQSLTFGSLAATYAGKGKCAVPLSRRTPGRSWGAGGGSP